MTSQILTPAVTFFIYADDTAVFFKHHNPDALQKKINTIIPKLSRWLQSNYLTLNESKTMYQIYSKRKINSNINVKINDVFIERKNTVKYLGIYIDENMKFISHINKITNTVSRNVGMMSRIRHFVETRQLLQLYNAIILPYLNYCCLIWGTGYAHHTKKLLILQKKSS